MWQRSKPYFLVLPAVGAIVVLFFGGLFEGLVQSLGFFPVAGQSRVSLNAYRGILGTPDFWNSLWLTLRISFLSTLIAGIFGLFVAVCLFMLGRAGRSGSSRFWQRFFQLPLVVPHLVGAYLMVLLFMQSGWLSRIMFGLGLIEKIDDFPVIINEPFGWGIILAYAWKEAPFIALMLYPVLLRIHESWLEVAQVFGAGRWEYFREILFPLLVPAWITSGFIVFAFTFSAFEVPFLLGVTYPKMLPVFAYDLYTSGGLINRPEALAVNVILAVITAFLGFIAYRISRRWVIGSGRGW
jgi:putative spermidine/putrescine transport system permease protein